MKILVSLAVILLAARALADDTPLDEAASTLRFTGHAFLHDFHGEAKEFHGAAQIDLARPELVRTARIDITTAKMTTLVDERDRNMDTWLNVTANPNIRFELTKVTPVAGDVTHATKANPALFTVRGTLRLNRVDKPLVTTASAWCEGQRLIIEGTTQIDTADHGLPEVRTLFLTVDKNVDVAFHLVFELP